MFLFHSYFIHHRSVVVFVHACTNVWFTKMSLYYSVKNLFVKTITFKAKQRKYTHLKAVLLMLSCYTLCYSLCYELALSSVWNHLLSVMAPGCLLHLNLCESTFISHAVNYLVLTLPLVKQKFFPESTQKIILICFFAT